MKDTLFRACVFGGYKKEDVNAYVGKLESEIARLEAQLQERGGEQMSKAAPETPNPYEDDIIVLSESADEESPAEAAIGEDSEKTPEDYGSKSDTGKNEDVAGNADSVQKELEEAKLEIERLKRSLDDARAECEQSTKDLRLAVLEKQQLEVETEKIRHELEEYGVDRDAIKEVLLNARVDAEVILTKARQESKLLLENTNKQISDQKRTVALELVNQLSENYIGLQASRSRLEEQVRSMERMEKEIEKIKLRVEDKLGSTFYE